MAALLLSWKDVPRACRAACVTTEARVYDVFSNTDRQQRKRRPVSSPFSTASAAVCKGVCLNLNMRMHSRSGWLPVGAPTDIAEPYTIPVPACGGDVTRLCCKYNYLALLEHACIGPSLLCRSKLCISARPRDLERRLQGCVLS